MSVEKIVSVLEANKGKRVRLTFIDGEVQAVVIGTVDSEGFLHSGPDCADPYTLWTRCEHVQKVETDAE